MHEYFMGIALEEANLAYNEGEVPIGAVVVKDNQIISRAHNRIEKNCSATSHAEVLAIDEAAKQLKNWRLTGCSLYVTLEPCVMCIGALLNSRIDDLYFGAYDKRAGAVGSCFDLSDNQSLPHQIKVFPELCAEESLKLLNKFFGQMR